MEPFFLKPTPSRIANEIHNMMIAIYETGGWNYSYKIPSWMSVSFVHEVIGVLNTYHLDTDTIRIINDHIYIDWS